MLEAIREALTRRNPIFERSIPILRSGAVEKDVDSPDADHAFAGVESPLVVLAESPRTPEPGNRSFHDPALWEQDEAFCFGESAVSPT